MDRFITIGLSESCHNIFRTNFSRVCLTCSFKSPSSNMYIQNPEYTIPICTKTFFFPVSFTVLLPVRNLLHFDQLSFDVAFCKMLCCHCQIRFIVRRLGHKKVILLVFSYTMKTCAKW